MKKIFLSLLMTTALNLSATTYKDAGVDIDNANELVDAIKPVVKETARPGADAELGGFGGLFDLAKLEYKDPILVSTTDGVGTKLKLAIAAGKHDTIGIDLVAMCVNDLLAQGAEPLLFLDYYATGKLNNEEAKQIITGIADGCKQAQCALIGGETAEMPGIYKEGEYDLAGFSVGIVERGQILPKLDEIEPGDVMIGIGSSGVHSNGFSLVRKLIADNELDLMGPAPFITDKETFVEALLEPTVIYVQAVLPLCKQDKVKAIAHITGGGLIDNIPRVLPSHLTMEFGSWEIPPVFQWIQEAASLSDHEMARTYNQGIGMVLIASPESAEEIINHLESNGHKASVIGSLKS